MKKNTLLMAFLAGALVAPEILAQQNPNRPQRQPRPGQARDQVGRLAEQLKLTEKQREQWIKVQQEQAEKQRKIFQASDVPIEKRREQFAALRKETQEKQEKILTKEQLAKFRELRGGGGQARPGQGPGRRPGQGPGEGRPGGGRPGGGFGRNPYAQLNLTEEQQQKIQAIQQAQSAEMRKMFEQLRDGGGDREGMRAKFTEMREKFSNQMQAVLTDAQKKKLAEMQEQRGQGGNRPGGARPGGGFGRNPFSQLNLTEEQQKKMQAIQEAQTADMRKMLEELRNGGGDREGLRAKFTEMREKFDKQREAILTDAQKKKYQELLQNRPQRRPGQRPSPPRRDDI